MIYEFHTIKRASITNTEITKKGSYGIDCENFLNDEWQVTNSADVSHWQFHTQPTEEEDNNSTYMTIYMNGILSTTNIWDQEMKVRSWTETINPRVSQLTLNRRHLRQISSLISEV